MASRRNESDWQPSVALLQQGDELEWDKLQRAYWRRVYYFVRRFIEDHGACQDVVQDAFLGAARGIGNFDHQYNFEQYLFGIAKNRLIDHLRKRTPTPLNPQTDDNGPVRMLGLADLVRDTKTASTILREAEDMRRRRAAIARVMKDYVRELWQEKDFVKLKVIESIFVAGKRNKELWEKFGLRDESAVAGIKFRAIDRLQGLARGQDRNHSLFPDLWKKRWS